MFAHTSENVDCSLPAQAMVSNTKKSRFGDARFQQVYEQAKLYVIENKVLRLYQKLDIRSGYKTIIICNTWRIDRCLSSAGIEAFEWSYKKQCWESTVNFEMWPYIQLLPIDQKLEKEEGSQALALTVLRKALCQTLYAAGYKALPNKGQGGLERFTMAEIFIGFYLNSNHKKRTLKIEIAQFSAAARALRKNLWGEVIDRSLLSVVCALKGWRASVCLKDYFTYAKHGAAVMRIALEHRNCLPLLALIAPKHWGRPDLFSRKTWVKDGRKSTLIDRQGFNKHHRLSSFERPVALRWLLAAPFTVVHEYTLSPDRAALETIASSNLPKRVPAIVLCALVSAFRYSSPQALPEFQRTTRLWVLRCCEIWRARGFAYLRSNIEQLKYELINLLDWVCADGRARQLPDKNATWASIERLSAEWHQQRQYKTTNRGLVWESLLDDCEIGDFKVHALTTSEALAKEGSNMHHCVGNYDAKCHGGFFRVFGLSDSEGLRCTLNIEQLANGNWRVQQLQSYCNGPVSKAAHAIGNQIAKRYTALCTANAGKVSDHETV